MFAPERRQQILAALEQAGRVEVCRLASQLQVSEDTVRRDLAALAQQGFLQKTHGGAVRLAQASLPQQARQQLHGAAKQAIARAAAGLVEAHMSLFIDAGSSCLALAEALPAVPLTVLTNSLDVAQLLGRRPGIALSVCGGRWHAQDGYLAGPQALASVQAARADLAFLGACAIHPTLGVSAQGADNAAIKAAMLAGAARSVLLADHSKFGEVAPHAVAPLAAFSQVFSDDAPSWAENAVLVGAA
ncbi:DeoR/GlpR family DNA-binding transcription regulator [Massilia sp. TS11]|uniref:DeoR/GlpR family DNA-binding transcription regulator n=1 Tax=Massilia sp. TS11 TaxID=2908003 RepID=UPI001ED9E907|nr:DeoR/GlpR family DNA-binding transcription regulator [Massilia sp. TS11]MCG2585262.1 DeoR/GlpR family DNA-binding transcription regulator [Massilia sp. TS11]